MISGVRPKGEFILHSHPNTDEVFIVIEGEVRIESRDFHAKLSKGEPCVVPRSVEHKPVAEDECQIMLVEPVGTMNTGDAVREWTRTEENWII